MSELEVMIELAYLYGVHNNELETEEFDDFVDVIKNHAANLPVWFTSDKETSPLQVLHNYFFKEILGGDKNRK